MAFKDHFSGHASAYARYRPDYPKELFEYLATLTPRREVALDCATGSGQAAVGLARHYDRVVATDGSVAQLKSAQAHPHVAYLGNLAEQPALKDQSVDLAAAAQAAHWFDHARFHPEMRRVLRPDGVLAIWTYGIALVEPQIDAVVRYYYNDVVGPYWPPERRYVDDEYRSIPFPFDRIPAPLLVLEEHWDLAQVVGYMRTWSASTRYRAAHGDDPVTPVEGELGAVWGDATRPRRISWPLIVLAGRVTR